MGEQAELLNKAADLLSHHGCRASAVDVRDAADLIEALNARVAELEAEREERPDYIACISKERSRHVALCGGQWRPFFVGADHALLAIDQGQRLLPCRECLTVALRAALGGGEEKP